MPDSPLPSGPDSSWSRGIRRLLQALPQRWLFEALYALSTDPWDYAGDAHETARLDAMAEMLRRAPPAVPWPEAAVLEIGCSVGTFTRRLLDLGPRSILAVDISAVALRRARRATPSPVARFERLDIFTQAPPERYDLVVASDVLYYTDDLAMLSATRDRLLAALAPGGRLLLANTRLRRFDGEGHEAFPSGYPLLGATPVLDCFLARFDRLEERVEATWRMDLLQPGV